ncbi:hypothetical protein SRABI106_02431 [Rahnella aquatilis]|nr:hypothetical protein SRABI106_02431 [Rahnella aquatilis]
MNSLTKLRRRQVHLKKPAIIRHNVRMVSPTRQISPAILMTRQKNVSFKSCQSLAVMHYLKAS